MGHQEGGQRRAPCRRLLSLLRHWNFGFCLIHSHHCCPDWILKTKVSFSFSDTEREKLAGDCIAHQYMIKGYRYTAIKFKYITLTLCLLKSLYVIRNLAYTLRFFVPHAQALNIQLVESPAVVYGLGDRVCCGE